MAVGTVQTTSSPAARAGGTTARGLTAAETLFDVRNRTAALIAYRALSDLAGKAAFFAVTVLAARRLSGEEFGIVSLGTTLGWMVAVATDLGMQAHLARAVSHRPHDARCLLDVWLPVRLRAALAGLSIGAAVIVTTGARAAPALVVFVAAYVVSGLVEFMHHFYRGIARSDIESSQTLYWRAAMLGCAAAVLWLRPDVTLLAVALLAPAAIVLVVTVRRARRLAGLPAVRRHVDVPSELRRDVLPIGVGILLSAIYFRVDVLLIELWQGSTDVGLYNAVFRLVDALRLFPSAVLAVTLPALCRATHVRALLQVSAGLALFSVAVALVLWPAAGWLVPAIYGPGYAAAVPAFRILLLSFPLMSLNYALTQQLIAWYGHRAYAAVCAVALVFNLTLNARLIPLMSIVGAAWTTLATEIVVTAGCAAALWMARGRQRRQEVRVEAAW